MMPGPADREGASRLEWALLACILAFYAVGLPLSGQLFRPEFGTYDEESTVGQIQAWREGGPLVFTFAKSSLHRALAALLTRLGGPSLFWLRAPAWLGVLAEAGLLYRWLRDKLGARAALWAALADLVCTATFARGRSMLGASLLPALFLAFAVGAETLKRPWQALLWGLGAGLLLLDYEGWVGALLFLLPYFFWHWRARPSLPAASAAGGAMGLAVVMKLTPDWHSYFSMRTAVSAPGAGPLAQIFENLASLLTPSYRIAFSAAPMHAWPPPWTWPLALAGAGVLAAQGRRHLWLAALLAVGGLPLALQGSSLEPHRLSLALLAFGALAGAGAAWAWRVPWGRTACVLLLLFGCVDETRAWVETRPDALERCYGASRRLEAGADWMRDHCPAQGWDLISSLDPSDDAVLRFLLDARGVRHQGGVPVAMVPWDYAPALAGLRPGTPAVTVGGARPLTLIQLFPEDAARLRRISQSLSDLQWTQRYDRTPLIRDAALAWLRQPGHQDPWARTIAWEIWLHACVEMKVMDLALVNAMMAEPLVSGWGPDELAEKTASQSDDPRYFPLVQRFTRLAERIDPRRAGMPLADRAARY